MSSRTARRASQSLLSLVLGVALIAVALSAAINSVVAGAGMVVKSRTDAFLALPATFETRPLPTRSVMLDATGQPIAWFWEENREPVGLDSVSPLLQQALIATEDARFYDNTGVDYRAVARAALANQSGADKQGASTITQQYVKNLRLYSAQTPEERAAAAADTYERKAEEARFAIALASRMSKAEILQGYMNTVFFGNGAYGVHAASERYFQTSPAKLTLPQAALLAGLVQSPATLDPVKYPEVATARRAHVLARMADQGYITAQQRAAAAASPLGVKLGGPSAGCAGRSAGYFCDWVLRQLLADPALGKTPEERKLLLERGGLTIRTSLDPKVQRAADAAVRSQGLAGGPALASATVLPGTGAVAALAASVPFGVGAGQSSVNLPLGGSTGFQAGSTFKVFALAAAIEKKIPLALPLYSPQTYSSTVFKRGLGEGATTAQAAAPYVVSNAGDSEQGIFNLVTGTAHSVNTFYIQLEERIGIEAVAEMGERLGVRQQSGQSLPRVPSLTLGTAEVSPLSMAAAYAALAAHGKWCAPYAISAVTDRSGKALTRGAPQCKQVLDRKVADTTVRVLQEVLEDGTGGRARPDRPAAGKTGTVQDFSAAWFVGTTPELATAVWMGDPRGGYRYPLRNVTAGGTRYGVVYGGGVPAATWAALTREALKGRPAQSFQLQLTPQPTGPQVLVLPPNVVLPPGTVLPPGVVLPAPPPPPPPPPGAAPAPAPATAQPAARPAAQPAPKPKKKR